MGTAEIVEFCKTFGFPVALSIGLIYYGKQMIDSILSDGRKREETLSNRQEKMEDYVKSELSTISKAATHTIAENTALKNRLIDVLEETQEVVRNNTAAINVLSEQSRHNSAASHQPHV